MHRQVILIDLDGVLNTYRGDFLIDKFHPIKAGAKEFLCKLVENYDLVLFTTRNLLKTAKWLIENDIDKYFVDITNIKIPATLYIDDRALNFNGNFNDTLIKIDNFKTHWVKS